MERHVATTLCTSLRRTAVIRYVFIYLSLFGLVAVDEGPGLELGAARSIIQ